jgi:hypothetical protein
MTSNTGNKSGSATIVINKSIERLMVMDLKPA